MTEFMGAPVHGGGMQTDTQTMGGAAAHVDEVAAQVSSRLSAIGSQIAALEGQWVGAAKNAFDGRMVQWNDNATKLLRALEGIAENIRLNGKDYAQASEDHAAAFTRIAL